MTTSTMIQPNDVLFGRGGATNQHVGNKVFRELVAEQMPVYLRARKKDKLDIAYRIVAAIKHDGGRFLKKQRHGKTSNTSPTSTSSGGGHDHDDDAWVVVSDQRAREKTSQALREGLDVRHRTFRRRDQHKQTQLQTQEQQQPSHQTSRSPPQDNPRTRPRVVTGVVLLDSSVSMADSTPPPPSARRSESSYYSPSLVLVDDGGRDDHGGVPDLFDEEQFADAIDDEQDHHLHRLLIQFEPPRNKSPVSKNHKKNYAMGRQRQHDLHDDTPVHPHCDGENVVVMTHV